MKCFKPVLFVLCVIFISTAGRLYAQFYATGQAPASVKWSQIETPRFTYVFPTHDTLTAFKMANTFENIFEPLRKDMHIKPKKLPIILHTHSVISNGLVVWAPRRSELYPNLSQDMLSTNYMEHLAIHEYRHIVQMSKLHQGTGKMLYYLLGEQSVGMLTGLFTPLWFLEGDAVCAETAFSPSGRGRLPEFMNKYKALLLEKDKYAYDKAVYGSYKDFVPNHYELGYLITAQSRKNYGNDIWSNVLDNVAKKPYTLRPFSKGLKNNTGLNKVRLYNAVMDTLKMEWTSIHITPTYYDVISKNNKVYTRYNAPSVYKQNAYIAYKSSLNDNNKFVIIDHTRKEKTLHYTGAIITESISHTDSLLAYIEYKGDIRWQHRSYSNIVVYNLSTEKKRYLTKKSRYQSCALSSDGSKMAAVSTTTDNLSNLVIIETATARPLKTIKNELNYHFINPIWLPNNTEIICVLHNSNGKSIGIINTEKDIITPLFDFGFDEISYPNIYTHFILYNANYNGIDNVYAFDTIHKKVFQLTSSIYGASQAYVDVAKQRIIYLNSNAGGNHIVSTPFDSLLWKPLETVAFAGNTLFETLTNQMGPSLAFSTSASDSFDIKPYNKLKHLFNLHSWAPLYINTYENDASPGIIFMSQNLLNTATTTAGYKYNTNEKTGKYVLNFDYEGFFPLISTSVEHGNRMLKSNNSDVQIAAKESRIINGITLPFNLSKGKYFRSLRFYAHSNYIYLQPQSDSLQNRSLHALDYGLSFSNLIRTSHRDIYPRFAQVFNIKYAHTPLSGLKYGDISACAAAFYFPGVLKHNSFILSANYQVRNSGNYAFNYFYALPRGYYESEITYNSVFKITTAYALPLLYPDVSLGPLMYIKRIRSHFFYDYAETYNQNAILRSYGADVFADVHILRFIAPIELGLRSLYHHDKKRWIFEPLFSIKFDNI